MTSFRDTLSSPGFNRALPWIAGAVLLIGVFAFWQATTRTGSTPETFTNDPARNVGSEKTVPLAPEVRRIAVQFMKTAVVRKNLAQAWKISGPGIKQGLTFRQWMSGNIPVVPYPDAAIDQSPVKVDWSYPGDASLRVVLQPKPGSNERPQIFFIGLKKFGSGSRAKWLVDYWAPYAPPEVPANIQ